MLKPTIGLCLGLAILGPLSYAGELNPPAGPVAATGRFGPRIEINQANTPGDANSLFKITQRGSYYLGGNITGVSGKHGIEIASSGVTLDIMGFDLLGVLGSLDGVSVTTAARNVRICNGSVRGWGKNGVSAANAQNSSLSELLAEGNALIGLRLGSGGLVTGCAAMSNGADGFFVNSSSTITGCTASSNSGSGISVSGGCTVSGNTATFNAGDGIMVINHCYVLNNTSTANGLGGDGAGIHATNFDNRIESNNVTINDRGIDVDISGNLIIRNSASGNTVNYDIVAGNAFGSFQNLSAGGAIITNVIAGNGFNLPNAWANFIY